MICKLLFIKYTFFLLMNRLLIIIIKIVRIDDFFEILSLLIYRKHFFFHQKYFKLNNNLIYTLRMNDYQKRKKYCQNNQILHFRNSYKYFFVFSIDFLQYSYNVNWVTSDVFYIWSSLFAQHKIGFVYETEIWKFRYLFNLNFVFNLNTFQYYAIYNTNICLTKM